MAEIYYLEWEDEDGKWMKQCPLTWPGDGQETLNKLDQESKAGKVSWRVATCVLISKLPLYVRS